METTTAEAPAAPTVTPAKRVYLALPTYANSLRRDFFHSVLDLLLYERIPGVEFVVNTCGGDGVARSRNNMAQQFILGTDCEIMLSIDVDIANFRPTVERLLKYCSAERPIVAGRYACKSLDHRWIMTPLAGEYPDPETGLLKVFECGTGVKAFHRSYFERVMNGFPEIQYFCDGTRDQRGTVKWDFFSMGVVDGRYLSEDYYADYRARKLGIPIYVDARTHVEHEGFIRYPFAANLEVFKDMPIERLHALAEQLGDARPREFARNDEAIVTNLVPRRMS